MTILQVSFLSPSLHLYRTRKPKQSMLYNISAENQGTYTSLISHSPDISKALRYCQFVVLHVATRAHSQAEHYT